jgi:hypothetical protein
LTIQAETQIKYIKLRNIAGQLIIYEKFNSNQLQIDLSAFENGIYLLEISDDKNTEIKKVLLAK